MKNKLVSVIVPAYNEEKHIEECLQSIKNQTYLDVELIVIDDGSNDETPEISKKYADIFVAQKHLGPGVARNKGAKKASGEILVFIDADMYLDKNYIKNIIKPIFENESEATFTKEEYVANPENIWSKCFQLDNNLPFDRRMSNSLPSKYNKFRAILKKELFELGGYIDVYGYGEDNILKSDKATSAKGAICYHYNPDTLKEVFFSARWMGRSKNMTKNIKNLLRYSIINSFNISLKKIFNGAPFKFLIYKLVFDFGIFNGIFNKKVKQNYSK